MADATEEIRGEADFDEPFEFDFQTTKNIPSGFTVRDETGRAGGGSQHWILQVIAVLVILLFGSLGAFDGALRVILTTVLIVLLGAFIVLAVLLLGSRPDLVITRKGVHVLKWPAKGIGPAHDEAFVPWERINEVLIYRHREWTEFHFTLNMPPNISFADTSREEFEQRINELAENARATKRAGYPLNFGFRLNAIQSRNVSSHHPPLDFQHGWSRRNTLGIGPEAQRLIRILEEWPPNSTPVRDNTRHG